MTNKEMVADVLNTYGAMTSRQVAVQINKVHGVVLTPAQVAGAMRPLTAKGMTANSKDAHNKSVYWLTEYGVEQLRKGEIK